MSQKNMELCHYYVVCVTFDIISDQITELQLATDI